LFIAAAARQMGEIRDSQDLLMEFPSSSFGFGDWPIDGKLLLDDICQIVLTKNLKQGFGEKYTYDEYLSSCKRENKSKVIFNV